MSTVCYLCGKPLGSEKRSDDHRVPTLLIDRVQPKVRGFDYGGKAPTHENCNNRFAPEIHARRALDFIRVLHDPACAIRIQSRVHPFASAYALNSNCLSDFTAEELRYFRITDARNAVPEDLRNPFGLLGSEDIDPFALPRSACLSVLAKSAAALLIERHLRQVPPQWRVIAFLGVVEILHITLEGIFPGRQPFDKEVSIFIDPISDEDFSVVFRAHGSLAILAFQFSAATELVEILRIRFPKFYCTVFEGANLMQLVTHEWKPA